jgi:AhpD family alkylhydroperoxidase
VVPAVFKRFAEMFKISDNQEQSWPGTQAESWILSTEPRCSTMESFNQPIQGFFMSNRIDYAKASPEGYKVFGGVYATLQKSGLSQELVDLVYLRVSQINGCAYCIDMHSRDLLKLGVTIDKLVLVPVWHDAGEVFSARERIALAWAETVTRVAETGVPDADYQAATAEFSDKELADLTYAIGLMNAFNRFGIAFRATPAAAAKA